ncbi:MAG TPA: division/cell wall cluster transcriptional repressor MraZ [Syntrophobacteraceae bacterium]|nr:division/cell wall cluster transcriptional repressor MraZ [Syntrophobacteraceae bacterium]
MGNSGSSLFRGQSLHYLDEKGRLRVPTRFRDVLKKEDNDTLVLTMMGDCLVAYPHGAWQKIEEKALELSQIKPQQRAFMRYVVSSAVECEFDKQGRILIPPVLRDNVGLEKEAFLAGMLTTFEIWAKSKWDEQLKWSKANFQQMAEEMANFGL